METNNNISFTSKIFVRGKAPVVEELTKTIYAGAKKKVRGSDEVVDLFPLRTLNLTKDRFSYEKDIAFISHDDVSKLREIETDRAVERISGKPLTPYEKVIGKPERIFDADMLLSKIKSGIISVRELFE